MLKLKTATTAFASILAIALATYPVFAEDDNKNDRGWWHGMYGWMGSEDRGPMRRFMVVDANDDGRISDDEAAGQRELVFFAMDADDDGELTEEEFMAVRMGPGQGRNEERMKARQEAKRARFAPMDTDKSGKVSKAEFMAEGKARFLQADADKDGNVTPWEFRSMHQN